MSVEEINANQILVPQTVKTIIGDGACLFQSLFFL